MNEIGTTARDQRSETRYAIDWLSWKTWVVFLGSALATGGLAGALGLSVHSLVEYTFERQVGKPVVVLLIFVVAQFAALTLWLITRDRSRPAGHRRTESTGRLTMSDAVGLPKLLFWELIVFATGIGIILYYLRAVGAPLADGYAALIFLVIPVSEIARQLVPAALLRRAAD